MQLIPVSSSAISEIGWHNQVGLLIRFKGGHIWAYTDFERSLFDTIMAAPSKGKAFDQWVKKRNVVGVEVAEAELLALPDEAASPDQIRRWNLKSKDPAMYLRGLLKTNRASAYF